MYPSFSHSFWVLSDLNVINSFLGGFQLGELTPRHWDMRCRHPQWQLNPAHKAHPGFCAFPPKFPHTTLRCLLPGFSQEPERHPTPLPIPSHTSKRGWKTKQLKWNRSKACILKGARSENWSESVKASDVTIVWAWQWVTVYKQICRLSGTKSQWRCGVTISKKGLQKAAFQGNNEIKVEKTIL